MEGGAPGTRTRIGLVGYGALGKYLAEAIGKGNELELVWVWNRTADKVTSDPAVANLVVKDLTGPLAPVDLIVEVAHPDITRDHAVAFLGQADYFCGSPTCFSDADVERSVRAAAKKRACFVPAGALWGALDIGKMADRGNLAELTVTMAKNPSHLQLQGRLKDALDAYVADLNDKQPRVLFKGCGLLWFCVKCHSFS